MQLYLVDLTGTGVATMSSLAHLWDWDTEEQRQNRHVADWEWKCQKWAATCDAYRAIRLFFWIWNIRLVPLRWEPSFIPRPIYPVCVSAPGLVWIWDLDQMKHCWIKLTPEHLVKLLLLQTRPVMKLDMSLGWFNPTEPPQTCSHHSTGQGTRPVVELDMSSKWFNGELLIEPLSSRGQIFSPEMRTPYVYYSGDISWTQGCPN